MANGCVVLHKKQRLLRSLIASQQGKENFMIMRTMGKICPQDVLIQTVLNDITIRYKSSTCHSNYLNPTESKTVACASSGPSQNFCDQPRGKSRFEFVTTLKLVLPLAWQTQHQLSPKSANGHTCIGKMQKGYNSHRVITSSSDHIYTISTGASLANFEILAPNQAKQVEFTAAEHLRFLTQQLEEPTAVVNELLLDESTISNGNR